MSKIDEAVSAVRNAIDENWSERRRLVVGVGSGVIAVGAIALGIWVMRMTTPPSLPKTAEEAVRVMNSSRFDNLDRERRVQYAEAATRLLRDVPEEERRELFRDEDARRAMREAAREQFDDMAIRLAEGEPIEEIMQDMQQMRSPGGRPGGRPGGPPRDGNRDGNDADREQRQGNRSARMMGRFANALQTGNAQRMGLRMEFMQRMRQARENQRD